VHQNALCACMLLRVYSTRLGLGAESLLKRNEQGRGGEGGKGGGLKAAAAAAIVVKRKRDSQGPERAGGGGGGGGGIRDMESARKQETWKDEVKGGGRGRRDEEVEPRRKRPGEDEAGLGDQRKGGQTLRTFDDLRYPIPCR